MLQYDLVDGKFTNVMLNGKPVKKSHANALAKIQETRLWVRVLSEENQVHGNWESFTFNALEMSVYRWINAWQDIYGRSYIKAIEIAKVSTFDAARGLMMEIRPDAFGMFH